MVSSRVTFVIWILESIANICIFIHIVATGLDSGLNVGTYILTQGILWYYLVLPYTFLVNTSYNRDRIVDDGMKTILFNLLPSRLHCNIRTSIRNHLPTTRRSNQQVRNTEQNTGKRRALVNGTINLVASKSSDEQLSDGGKNSHPNKRSAVFMISSPTLDRPPSRNKYSPVPSSSQNTVKIIPHQRKKAWGSHDSLSDSKTENCSKGPTKPYRLKMGEDLIGDMKNHIDDETAYIHYLEQLIKFEKSMKDKNIRNKNKFVVVPFKASRNINNGKIKKTGLAQTGNSVSIKKEIIDTNRSKRSRSEEVTNNIFSGELLDRIRLRRRTLHEFQKYCSDMELYENFLNELINLEESLVQD